MDRSGSSKVSVSMGYLAPAMTIRFMQCEVILPFRASPEMLGFAVAIMVRK